MHDNLRGRRLLLAALAIFFLFTFAVYHDIFFSSATTNLPETAKAAGIASTSNEDSNIINAEKENVCFLKAIFLQRAS